MGDYSGGHEDGNGEVQDQQVEDLMELVADELAKAAMKMVQLCLRDYRAAGCPHGDTTEGFGRWMLETEREIGPVTVHN